MVCDKCDNLVGHTIKGGGIAITGQEQRIYGGGFDIFGKSGLQGEITLLQLYKAALTAGKAYINHKHHHANDYTHDDERSEDIVRRRRNSVGYGNENSGIKGYNVMLQTDHADQSSNSYSVQNVFLKPNLDLFDPNENHVNQVSSYIKQDFVHLVPTYEEQQTYEVVPKKQHLPKTEQQQPSTTQTEPAEWEVSKILQACTTECSEDAFRKANVMPWYETPKKLFAGVSYPKVSGTCYDF